MENPENPSEKKGFPWKWVAAGCGVLTVLAVAAVAVIILVVLPAVRSITTANGSPLSIPLPVPRTGTTAIPRSGSGDGAGTTIGDLPFKFAEIQDPTTMPDQSLMDQMITRLNLNTDTDFMAPKSYEGTASLAASAFTLGNGWCARDDATLQQNLANMKFELTINGNAVDLSQYQTLFFTDNRGDSCAETGIVITPSGILSGSYHVILTQKYLSSLNDGIGTAPYPAGDVKFDFSIQFKAAPNNGSNT